MWSIAVHNCLGDTHVNICELSQIQRTISNPKHSQVKIPIIQIPIFPNLFPEKTDASYDLVPLQV